MKSNLGPRVDKDQFAGWCGKPHRNGCDAGSGKNWQWNSCRREYPPVHWNSAFYNANSNREQEGIDTIEWYGTMQFDDEVDAGDGCEIYDGGTFTVENNVLVLYELDDVLFLPNAAFDAHVGTLWFPDISIPMSCDYYGCSSTASRVVSPTRKKGAFDRPDARIHLTIQAEFREEVPIADEVAEDSTVAFSPFNAVGDGEVAEVSLPHLRMGASRLLHGPPISSTVAGDLELHVKRRDTKAFVENATVLYVEHDDNNIRLRSLQLGNEGRGALRPRGLKMREVMVFADGFGSHRKKVFPTTGKSTVAVELEQGGAITGVVYSPSSRPIADAEVRVVYAVEGRRRGEVRSRIKGDFHRGRPITGPDGGFAILDVRPGVVFKLEVSHEEGNATLGPLNLRPGQKMEQVNVVLR